MGSPARYFTGSTYSFRNTILKDGVPWDLSGAGAAVTLLWYKPDSTAVAAQTASVVNDGTDGRFIWSAGTTFFSVAGCWRVYWKIFDPATTSTDYDGPFPIQLRDLNGNANSQTPVSSEMAYADARDLLDFYDAGQIGNLGSDSRDTMTVSEILVSPIIESCLLRASGEVELACVAGGRYSPLDLQSLYGASQGALKGLVCDLAFYHLTKRRRPEPEKLAAYKEAQELLKALRDGDKIFGFQEAITAGQMGTIDLSKDSQNRPVRPTELAPRLFGIRQDQAGTFPNGSRCGRQ